MCNYCNPVLIWARTEFLANNAPVLVSIMIMRNNSHADSSSRYRERYRGKIKIKANPALPYRAP